MICHDMIRQEPQNTTKLVFSEWQAQPGPYMISAQIYFGLQTSGACVCVFVHCFLNAYMNVAVCVFNSLALALLDFCKHALHACVCQLRCIASDA